MIKVATLLCVTALLLSACGSRQPLRPAPGADPIPKAAAATRPATAEELMTPEVQARPARNIELLTRSDERGDDPFDLPQGGKPTSPAPTAPTPPARDAD